jgi:glycosyltransferase involved in cell wall biosynthesis
VAAQSSDPLLTVVVAAYNAESTLARALESLTGQDYPDWEAVVVDDGSTDATRQVIDRFVSADDRITAVSQENAGTAAARNAGIASSRGRYISVLDADDEFLPGYMSTMAAFVSAHPGFDIYSCNQWVVWPDGRRQLYADDPEHRPWVSMEMTELLQRGRYLSVCGSLTSAGLLDDLGGFRTGIYCEDVDLWRRAFARRARHIFCPEPLVIYHRDVAGQKTSDLRGVLQSLVLIDTDLLDSGLLTPGESDVVREKIASHTRRLLEEKIRLGDTTGTLSLLRAAKPAYRNLPAYYAALVAGIMDERLLALIAGRGRRKVRHPAASVGRETMGE